MQVSGKMLSLSDDSEDPRFYERNIPEDDRPERGRDGVPDTVASMALAMDWALGRIAG